MLGFISNSPLARDLIRIGEQAIALQDDVKLRDYFTPDYAFHGPGANLGYEERRAYFGSLRAAFSGLRLVREQIIVDGNFLAARTTFSGDLTGVFTYSPIGPVEPTGQHLEWEVIGTFKYDDEGRLAEEWVQTDYRGFLTKLGPHQATFALSQPEHTMCWCQESDRAAPNKWPIAPRGSSCVPPRPRSAVVTACWRQGATCGPPSSN